MCVYVYTCLTHTRKYRGYPCNCQNFWAAFEHDAYYKAVDS